MCCKGNHYFLNNQIYAPLFSVLANAPTQAMLTRHLCRVGCLRTDFPAFIGVSEDFGWGVGKNRKMLFKSTIFDLFRYLLQVVEMPSTPRSDRTLPPKECLLSVEGGIPFTHGRHSFEAKKAARGPLPVIFMPRSYPPLFFHCSVLSHKNYFYFSLNDENPLMFRFFFLSLQDETIKNCIFQLNIWIGRA